VFVSKKGEYQPPHTITPAILHLVAEIGEAVGRLSSLADTAKAQQLRRINRIRTIQGSLAIEGNTLSEEQITAILDGKRVMASPREIQEARNAITAYDSFERWQPHSEKELLEMRIAS
jgi:Fic family protein